MGRTAHLRSFGGILAVALIAHLWMFPALDGTPRSHDADLTAAATVETPIDASCSSTMAACVATGAEELRLPLAVVVSSLPALLWALGRRPTARTPRTRSSRHGREPPLTPVDARVLLLE